VSTYLWRAHESQGRTSEDMKNRQETIPKLC
jgi:hypothetical protein